MSCLYSDFNGLCSLHDPNLDMNGCDTEGLCLCEEDPDPSYTCDSYESDYVCPECGCDLNNDECECED